MNPLAPRKETLFRQAIALATAPERAAFLDQACAGDAALRRAVEELLIAREATVPDTPAGPATPMPPGPIPPRNDGHALLREKAGDRLGRYRLLKPLGEGGCGVVYLAEQEEPVRREVALKIIKLGMDTRQVVARFEAERQALAVMDHPNIARVLDAGATETGRPYFVMELVRGQAITEFCDVQGLTMAERIKIFIKVCQAIQHAHQKGIIHRDIKPSNILVAMQDGVAVPKVIDFGIAKAMDDGLAGETRLTVHQQFLGTPAYASPEQAEGGAMDVDTRSDIYSLGAVLYELLTGCEPLDLGLLGEAALLDARRKICDRDPVRPSTRLSRLDESALLRIASRRSVGADRLRLALRGDLDWIVMRCLEKDRAHRYETANGLAMDLRRYLNNEPVAARPPSIGYVALKLVRRHKLPFAAGAAMALTLIIALVVSTVMFVRERAALKEQAKLQKLANEEAGRARTNAASAAASAAKARAETQKSLEIAAFMKEMIASLGPVALVSESQAWRQIVDQAAQRLGTSQLHPDVEWELRTTLADVYASLEQKEQVVGLHRAALRLARQHPEMAPDKVIDSLVNLGWALIQHNAPQEAERLLQEALLLAAAAYPPDDPKLAGNKGRLGWTLMRLQQPEAAEPLCREALRKARECRNQPGRTPHKMPGSLASYATGLAYVMQQRGNLAEAEALFREAVETTKQDKGENHPDLRSWMHNLAAFLQNRGQREEAEALYRKAWDLAREQAPNHPGQISGAANLVQLLRSRGEAAEADKIIARLVTTPRALPAADRLIWAEYLGLAGVRSASHEQLEDAFQLLNAASELGSASAQLPAQLMTVATATKHEAAARAGRAALRQALATDPQTVPPMELCAALALWPAVGGEAADLAAFAPAARSLAAQSEWWALGRALADYRCQQYDTAAKFARESARIQPPGQRIGGKCLLALCAQRAGNTAEARALLEESRRLLTAWNDMEPPGGGRNWMALIIARELLEEAQRELGGQK